MGRHAEQDVLLEERAPLFDQFCIALRNDRMPLLHAFDRDDDAGDLQR